MKTGFFLSIGFALLIMTGCSKKNLPTQEDRKGSDQQHPISLAAPVANVFTSFSFDFFKTQQSRAGVTEDLFVSPLSLHIALGMLANGAEGSTHTEIMNALKAEQLSQGALNQAYSTLLTELPQADPAVEMALANAIFYKNGFSVEAPFLGILHNSFNAEITALPFLPEDLTIINQWASDHTNGKIPQVLQELSPNLVMLLMNALYFKGDWRIRFDKKNTAAQPFYREAATASTVQMMQRKDTFELATGSGYRALQLAYGNGQFRATLLLPDEDKSITDIFNQLDAAAWQQLQRSFQTRTVQLGLPKFKLSAAYDLNKTLEDMGMVKVFQPDAANLEGISPVKPLFVSFVKQNTFAAVDEQGTEAAAVTTIGVEVTSAPAPPPQFICNKPFGLIISEKTSNTILFMGRIMDPKQ
ncbi:serpin family protein [Niabella terrae]